MMPTTSVSIVVHSNHELHPESFSTTVLYNLVKNLAADHAIGLIVLIDNSELPYFDALVSISNKILYIKPDFNLGYGRGHNLARYLCRPYKYHLIVNPDVIIADPCLISELVLYMESNPCCSMTQPLITDPDLTTTQYLCKRNPALLNQLIRGFFPFLANTTFRDYIHDYEMRSVAYSKAEISSQYLSGCFMFCRRDHLDQVGWFDRRFFMYLEDADLSRRLSALGKCIHNPRYTIGHIWNRGSHKSLFLRYCAIKSFFVYSSIWGLKWY